MKPVALQPLFFERVWGSRELEPWFPRASSPIGEVWFTSDGNMTSAGEPLRAYTERYGAEVLGSAVQPGHGGRFPLLLKLLFPSEKLSVQVHPDDAYSIVNEDSPGKTEMWHVLRAEIGASIALGFRQAETPESVRAALADSSIETRLHWRSVAAGDAWFVPARVVHAIGGGMVVFEVQQNSDVTYRLWDYRRPRELHVEKCLAIADLGVYQSPDPAGCAYFRTERCSVSQAELWRSDPERFHLLAFIAGEGFLAGEVVRAGEVWLIPAKLGDYAIEGAPELEILRVFVPPC